MSGEPVIGEMSFDENGEISVQDGAKTGVLLATLGQDGPNGGFFYQGDTVPW